MPLPDTLTAGDLRLGVRTATPDDLPRLVAELTDDVLGSRREDETDLEPYRRALAAITADPAHQLVVVHDGVELVAFLQWTLLPTLARQGAPRVQLEGIRVATAWRGRGVGEAMLRWAVVEARRRGAALVQLTSDTRREDAHRFYERLDFVASHTGFKLQL